MALIIPKNNADEQTLDATLKIYYDADDWVENSYLIDNLSSALDNLGKEEFKKEPQSYTKKTQVLAYYGFITWEDVTNAQSRRRITELGKRFYDARRDGVQSAILDILIESLKKCTFGRNVIGCNSDSDLEPPNIFLKSALLLEGISLNEFAYILQRMEFDKVELADAIFDVTLKRKMSQSANPNTLAAKWTDPKPIMALGNWGLFHVEKVDKTNHYFLNKDVVSVYSKELMALRTKNTEVKRFVMNDDNKYKDWGARQQIFYGAPGTGKSHKIKRETKGNAVIRTTFHPDSDYSTFVGCYKPSIETGRVYGPQGPLTEANGKPIEEPKIIYKYVMQAFLKAYLGAWKKYADRNDDKVEPQFLVIEEINRGNCAQIFGDLFQLLDRGDKGFSEYPIEADTDLQQEIDLAFKENKEYKLENAIDVEGEVENYTSNYGATLSEDIQSGRVLLLPSNLYIWATMNTSDQSLFPIDSAFKRRWDWEYMPIGYKNDNWTIVIGEKEYKWVDFQQKINEKIYNVDNSEDKKLGDYFVNADRTSGKISADTLLNKILFYIWNDVCKDEPDQIFRWKDDKDSNKEKSIKFSDFFCDENERNRKLQGFMSFLEVKANGDTDESRNQDGNETIVNNDNDVNS